ncbi:hypothetical protein GBA52_005642 [Prunus armeniaca]|nr:hypothetical protein GBA52_005642 [Prunus armeniaca]
MQHGPAFIFPLNQQHAAAAASVRPASVKSPNAGAAALSSTSNSAPMTAAATAAPAPAMSFNYPNMAGNEPQYLAILQNNAYPFTMPPHVGAPPAYRGPHAQPMPYFSGSFYSSQMLHPSHLQQQQQQQPPPSQSQQSQQGHQNPSISSGSSSSQKHLQNQQQRPHPSGVNGGSGSLQGFPTTSKTHLHKHYSCSSSNGHSSRTHILRTKLANLSLKWGAKIAHQLLIVESLVRM